MCYNRGMEYCDCCPRRCRADRVNTTGYCGERGLKIARASLHMWEEPPISGTRGSGTIFFSGCNLKCVYCQNYDISRGKGSQLTVAQLADLFKRIEDSGAHNVNLVTATHFSDMIVKAFELYKPSIPVVYNCGGYESKETLSRLDGIVDVYLPDLSVKPYVRYGVGIQKRWGDRILGFFEAMVRNGGREGIGLMLGLRISI